jgi:ATP-dependent helicase HrpB
VTDDATDTNGRFNALPLDAAWPKIKESLDAHRNLVLVAEPGAGKTTRFPPLLLKSGLISPTQKILMLEPRRLAARASAHRIAVEQGWTLGGEVGYQVRFDNRTSKTTRLEVLTEGLLARRLQTDPELRDVGAVILDEFHERSQHTDLALGLLFELQQLSRPDLRLIVMSATLDAERVSSYLSDAPVVKVPGRTYPVDVQHNKKPLSLDTGPSFLDAVAAQILDVITGIRKREGDILVFLPGAREIRGVRERITSQTERAGFTTFELHGSLSLEEQDRAIQRSRDGRGKVVLATNIAETSLTIDGVGTVIDSGLARVVRLDAAGFERLGISRISLASATQRAGRAGRQGPGYCYRLWSKLDEASFPAFEQPELLRTNLSNALLTLLSQGVTDPQGFSWFEKPPAEAIRFALDSLTDLGLRDRDSGALTNEGREALKLPLEGRFARLVLEAVKVGATDLGAKLSALLSERDIATRSADLKRQAPIESDLLLRLHLLDDSRNSQADRFGARNVLRVADAIAQAASRIDMKRLRPANSSLASLKGDDLALRLLLLAFPDRVCRRRRAKEPQARMVGGRGVTLAPFSAVETSDLFIAIDSTEPPAFLKATARVDAQISIASTIERSWLEEYFPASLKRSSQVVFDEATQTVQKHTAMSFNDLPLEEPHVSRPSADEAFPALLKATRDQWDIKFIQDEELGRLLSRLEFLKASPPEDKSLDETGVRDAFLEEACFGESRLSDVLEKPLSEIYLRHLPAAYVKLLDDAPDTIVVPSGSRIRVHYPVNRAPYLEVRIQEIFGLKSSPRVGRARTAIVMHLLGPNFRPVQVTSDLDSFWKSGYSEVRKELRTRYPKHSWPEDPTTATPEAKGRRRS